MSQAGDGSWAVRRSSLIEGANAPTTPAGDRPWGPGNSPKSAVHAYLAQHPEFEIDRAMDHRLLISPGSAGDVVAQAEFFRVGREVRLVPDVVGALPFRHSRRIRIPHR